MQTTAALAKELAKHEQRGDVIGHPFLRKLKVSDLSRDQAEVIIGQYWYPMHNFTSFLPKVVSIAPNIETKTEVSRIMWQELGEGDAEQSHEALYLSTFLACGLRHDAIAETEALPATDRLIDGYKRAAKSFPPSPHVSP